MNDLLKDQLGLWQELVKTIQTVVWKIVEVAKEFWKLSGLEVVFQGLFKIVLAVGKAITTVLGGLLKMLGSVLSMVRGVLDPTGQLDKLFNGTEGAAKKGNRNEAPPRTGGFEDLQSTYRRIAVASLRASGALKSPEERTAAACEQANEHLKRIDGHTAKPGVVLGR